MEFRLSKENDILELSSWFKSQKEIQNWGGPKIRFPFTIEEFKKDINFNIMTSYTLVQNSELIGFIQVFDKYDSIHIGRVAIHPNKRGRGLGVELLEALFKKYKNSNQSYSLFVHKDNIIAKNLYEKLGFEISSSLTPYENENNCFYMQYKIN